MNIIFVGNRHGQSRTLKLRGHFWLLASVFVAAVLGASGFLGYHLAQVQGAKAAVASDTATIRAWQGRLEKQQTQVADLKQRMNQQIDALTMRLGNMQGRLLQLDALGQKLVKAGHLDNGEFNFSEPPPLGGPEDDDALGGQQQVEVPDLDKMVARLDAQISDREKQLSLLNELLANKHLQQESYVEGRPLRHGWISSWFGYRIDPFDGKREFHPGIDFAAKRGTPIHAVAAGVITWAGRRGGYGNMVEITHDTGLRTRYGHCEKILVHKGDIVKKGQVIALVGSTGRSTGPHVHFEVIKDGRKVNPKSYIARSGP